MRWILAVVIMAWCGVACADKCYVYIDSIGKVEQGQESGQTAKGDVVTISPYTDQYKPTPSELSRYKIVVMDLTIEEMRWLMEQETTIAEEGKAPKVVTARKRKIDLATNIAKAIPQEATLDSAEKSNVFAEAVVDKTVSVIVGTIDK